MQSAEVFRADKILYQAVRNLRLPELNPHPDYFNYLLRCITFQQLSGKAGETIYNRFLSIYSNKLPKPDQVTNTAHDRLRSSGLSNQKAGYIRNIAEFWIQESLSNSKLDKMDDEKLINYLTNIKGVGKWTAEVLMIFGMVRHDLFPLDDLGIQQGMILLYDLDITDKRALKNKMIEKAELWRPNRSLACRYIWMWKDLPENRALFSARFR